MVLYIHSNNDQGTLLRLRIGLVKIKKEMSAPARSNLLREHRAPYLLGLSKVGSLRRTQSEEQGTCMCQT